VAFRPRPFLVAIALGLSGCATQSDILGQATLLVDRERYADAEALLDKRLAAHPEDVPARRLLIRVLGLKGNLGRAQQQAEALARYTGPGSPVPWVELGHAFELTHRYEEALAMYDRAAEWAPKDPLGPRTGGLRTARWGERELARPRLEEALRRDSRDAVVWHALGLVCLGLGDRRAAENAYRSGLMADPRALENHVGLATLAFMEERPDSALREYDAILAERPNHADALLGRSLALIELGRLDEAERALSQAAERGASRAVVAKQRRLLAGLRAGADPRRSDAPTPTP
jgi:tetratricopeptide (TPR) repeat protein